MKMLNINAIRMDGGTQSRVEINNEIVADYAELIRAGIEFPPVVVFHDGANYWLGDGNHRIRGCISAEKASIAAEVRAGTLRDAILFSLGANRTHGLRRSNADKRKAVETMLRDPEWVQWSDRKIANACGVNDKTVASHRASIFGNSEDANPAVRTVERAGKTYQQDTGNIGKTKPAAAPAAAPSPAPAPAPAVPPAVEEEYFGPSAEEIAAAEREQEAELAAFRLLQDENDQLATAVAEVKRLTALTRVLEERVNGLMHEKNAALAAAKSWQRKAEKAERALKAAA